eukprot:TRINITY_DN455_c0_g4_i1.p1 TRINITY_DN455_c0_g4~~TRINITY_DN455_c0_g4_i1.p1  ORF type:complete len:1362 (-),score=197.70 TRINITY_DN455_c0_g4_i1:4439-8524(-)
MSLKDSVLRAYEEYVLSGKNLELALKGLVEGSQPYNYLKCIDALTKRPYKLTPEDRQILDEYVADHGDKNEISMRYLLLQYDTTDNMTDKERTWDLFAPKFNHVRPADFGKPTKVAEEGVNKSDGPIMDSVDLKKELEQLYKKTKTPEDFSPAALAEVDFQKLSKEYFFKVLVHMGQMVAVLNSEAFYDAFVGWLKKGQDEKHSYEIEEDVLLHMTFKQLEQLVKRLPKLGENWNIIECYFQKKFWRKLDHKPSTDYKERYKDLKKIYKFSEKLPKQFEKNFKSTVLYELLKIGIKLDVYNEEYFLEYLEAPHRECHTRKKLVQNCDQWSGIIESNIPGVEDNKVIKKHLNHFLKKSGEYFDKFKEYFDKGYLKSLWERAMITSGKSVKPNNLNTTRLEHITSEVSINICESNPDLFNVNEDIKIWLEIKNIPTLYVKVFEINAEKYYRSTLKPFNSGINLDGLVASLEKTLEFKQPPQIEFRQEISFPELKGRKGVFVVDFIGNGKSSRAVIKVGSLSFVQVPTMAGQMCYLLNETRKTCNGPKTGIWVDEQLFMADPTKGGRIIIPYSPKQKTVKAILIHEEMAQLTEFQRYEENYALKCGFFLLPEGIISGSQVTIAIKPQLLINGREGDVNQLKNMKCILHTSNYIDEIPTTKSYENLILSKNQELLIKFQIPVNLKTLKAEFTAEAYNVCKEKTQSLSATHEFQIETHARDKSIMEFYLKPGPKGYSLCTLGKNGEPLQHITVSLKFTSDLFAYTINKDAVTDQHGAIDLGSLKGVSTVKASRHESEGTISRTWTVSQKVLINYPEEFDIVQGETIELPVNIEEDPKVYVLSHTTGMTIKDCSESVTIGKHTEGSLYKTVKVSGLKDGTYTLWITPSLVIKLKVHKGDYWEANPRFIMKETSLIEKRAHSDFIKIAKVDTIRGEKKASMQIKVEGKAECRVHAFLFRYLPTDLPQLTEQLLTKAEKNKDEFIFQKWRNLYLSNKELSPEFRYCLERRSQKKFMGNTLEKPKLLLRREFVQNTETKQEQFQVETEYQENANESLQRCKQQKVHRIAKQGKMKKGKKAVIKENAKEIIPLYQNFIADNPVTLYNLQVHPETGVVTIELEQDFDKNFACIYVVAVDNESATHYISPLAGNGTHNKDLTLRTTLDINKSYAEMRTAQSVMKNQSHTIQDMGSTDFQIVDSLEKVLMVIKELILLRKAYIPELGRFEKLVNWDKLSEEEKNKFLSAYSSHELHLFIYKKDPEYFNIVVKPYLVNKMEKTLIDYYVLQDKDKLLEYAESPPLYAELNPLEKALLIEALVQVDKRDMAETYVKRLRDALYGKKVAANEQNKVFDTVLALNMLKTDKDGSFQEK